MNRRSKLVDRFRACPRDFTWKELVKVLEGFGYTEVTGGKTGGSRRRFIHPDAASLSLHKPHPGTILKLYALEAVLQHLKDEGLL